MFEFEGKERKYRTSGGNIETFFNQLTDLALKSNPLEEKFFLEMKMVERLAGMINLLPGIRKESMDS